MITPVTDARHRLATYDQRRAKHLYMLALQAFGYEGEQTSDQSGFDDYGDGILRFEDISPYSIQSGQSDLMKARAMIAAARLLGKDPQPEFVGDIPKLVAQVRQSFFTYDYHGSGDVMEGFGQSMREAFLDASNLGYGGVRFGLTTDPSSGQPRATGRYIKRLYTMSDPMKRSPVHSRWVATWDWMEDDEAAAIYGWQAVKHAVRENRNNGRAETREACKSVRVLEYFDLGYGKKGKPTYMVWVGGTDRDPVVRMELEDGHIPIAWGVNFIAPGMSDPLGSIQNMIAAQDARRAAIEYFQRQLDRQDVDIYDPQAFDPAEYNKILAGEERVQGNLTDLAGSQVHTSVPGGDIKQGALEYFKIVMDEWNTQSMTADFDRAVMGKTGRSATEWAIMDKRLSMNQALEAYMTAMFQRRAVIRHEQAALLGDYHPRSLAVKQHTVRVNVPGKPESWIGEYVGRPAEVTLNTQAMTADEDEIRRMAQVEKLVKLAELGLIDKGIVDIRWWADALIEASGFDPDQAMVKAGDTGGMAMMAAMQATGMQAPGMAGQTPGMGQMLAGMA